MTTTFIITAAIIILDQSLKIWTQNYLTMNQAVEIIPNFFQLNYIQNTGAGWGLFDGQRFFLIGVTFLVIFYLVYLIWKNRYYSLWAKLAYALLLGGAVGNLIDRLLRGYVVDMLQIRLFDFPIFNLADTSLTLGVILLIIMVIWTDEGSDLI
ncbi:signal peptidase II [Facklamia sp. 7083-14-GEN3]|uniref:signal peptidase II n=1 Tax=Facklamia sp. 7083-14-GEN3 TaxID=2973478 RepID=UPI00215C5A20|nr:signal peptidase II [Facklamia sp. 7083-14-GEN3]MCR8968857.1 signal peptidase II [Facklamia sp. 7083-14-GEN3]